MARRGGSPFRDVGGHKLLRIPSEWASKTVAGISGGGGGGAGAVPALIASSVSGLGAGPFADGQIAVIRVGTWPDTEYIELMRDAQNSVWVSKMRNGISQSDINYMGTNSATFDYIDTNAAGTQANSIGWNPRYIRRAQELYAAGLKIQLRANTIMQGSSVPAGMTIRARFFQHNDGDAVVFSADGSAAVAETPAITGPNSSTITHKSINWSDLLAIGTSNPVAAAAITKKNLWPRLYGFVSGGQQALEIDFDLEYRWVA